MIRAHLADALASLARRHGFPCRTAPDEYLSELTRTYPAAWLSPPSLYDIDGRRHGTIRYDIRLRLLDLGARIPHEARHARLNELEENLIAIFTELTEDPRVIEVQDLRITPRTMCETTHGEISQTATARVLVWF